MMFSTRAWPIAAAILAAAAFAQPADAKNCGGAITCECGDTVIASRTLVLGQDPIVRLTPTPKVCGGQALNISAPGVILDLGGNAIQGSPQPDEPFFVQATGILISADNVTVQNGKISGFRRAISTVPDEITINTTSNSTIKNMTVGGNPKQVQGTFLNKVGIELYGSNNTIQGNIVTETEENGIQIGNETNTLNDGNHLISNTVTQTGFDSNDPGISVSGCGNTFKDNSATGNAGIGIRSRFPDDRQPPEGLDPQHPTCNIDRYGNTSSGNCQEPGVCFVSGPDIVPVECDIDGFPCIPNSAGFAPLACSANQTCGDTTPCCCGDTLIASRTLVAGVGGDDVVTPPRLCPGAGIILGADGVNLDLGGNTLRGLKGIGDFTAAGFGVLINADDVTVKNGTINLFNRGVSVAVLPSLRPTNQSTLMNLTLNANRRGLILFGSDNAVAQNAVVNSIFVGVGVGSDDSPGTTDLNRRNQFTNNVFNSNGVGGDSGARGLSLIGCDNTLSGNVAKFNGAEGILTQPEVGVVATCNTDDGGNRGAGNCQFPGTFCRGQCLVDNSLCVQPFPGNTTVGLFKSSKSKFFLRNALASGTADTKFKFGTANAGWLPITGDWTGDGKTQVGLYDPVFSVFHLRNVQQAGPADSVFIFGPPSSGRIPLAGDWNGDGITTVGLYDPVKGKFFLQNGLAGSGAQTKFKFGDANAGWLPITGDWTGSGSTQVGLYDPSTSTFHLRFEQEAGPADLVVEFGPKNSGRLPVAGDWNNDGEFTVGLYDPAKSKFFLNQPGTPDHKFKFEPEGAGVTGFVPITGNWDGLDVE